MFCALVAQNNQLQKRPLARRYVPKEFTLKMKIIFFILVIFSSVDLLANESYVERWTMSNGLECSITFDSSHELRLSTHWDGNGDPPIKISEAKKIVSDWVANEYQGKVSEEIVRYSLSSYRAEGFKTNQWLYNISFVKFRGGEPDPDFNENIVVLMDGSTLSKRCRIKGT